jgi:hypothetical protein
MNIITNPPTALMPPTLNGGVALNFTALTGFALVDPGGILEILNNTGAALGNLSIALIGTADSADANGVLTCAFNQSDYTGCSAHSSAGTGNPLMMPGQPPWTWNFTGGSVAAGADFELMLGSFNANDHLTFSVPAPAIGHGLPVVLAVGGLLFGATLLERSKKPRSVGTAISRAAA